MTFGHFSRNGELLPAALATVPLSNIAYQYGFGAYETIRVDHGSPRFLSEHLERLIDSARIVGLAHPFTPELMEKSIHELLRKNGIDTCNLKMVLIGGDEPELDIVCLNPRYPDKKLYRDGADCITYAYERPLPHAKTLNMLESYRAFARANRVGAYDALLVDRMGNIREGAHTNFFCITGSKLVSPPEENILLGVTRRKVLEVAGGHGFDIDEKELPLDGLKEYDGAFLTGTSVNIMPVRSIDGHAFVGVSPRLRELMGAFDAYLASKC